MDLKDIPVIDAHCHLFDLAYKERNLAELLSLSLEDWDNQLLRETLVYKRLLRELSQFYGVDNEESAVLSLREKKCKESYSLYVKNLFDGVNLKCLIIDLGYKPAAVDLKEFAKFAPCRVEFVYRIETLLDDLWQNKKSFDEALQIFRKTLREQVEEGVVAFKSIIGYRTGLDITIPDYAEAQKAYEVDDDEKIFRDFFFNETIKMCNESDLPFQIHAAFGESNVNILKNNPLLLKRILDEPQYKDVKLVLVHGGYPYCFEAGYLAGMYPNLYLDFSEIIPWLTFDSKEAIKKILDMAPFSKIMYGSDGFIVPELHFFGALTGKKVFGQIIKELIDANILKQEEGLELAEKVLYKNAKVLFKIKT